MYCTAKFSQSVGTPRLQCYAHAPKLWASSAQAVPSLLRKYVNEVIDYASRWFWPVTLMTGKKCLVSVWAISWIWLRRAQLSWQTVTPTYPAKLPIQVLSRIYVRNLVVKNTVSIPVSLGQAYRIIYRLVHKSRWLNLSLAVWWVLFVGEWVH